MPLSRLRTERDTFSAIERRIADFVLANSGLLRDYSSQQLAEALGISQSSVVKFAQKLGFRGYPDLKLAVAEAVVRPAAAVTAVHAPTATASDELLLDKQRACADTIALNPLPQREAITTALARAGSLQLIGLGADDLAARTLALRLSLSGFHAIQHFDAMRLAAAIGRTQVGDALIIFSERGQQAVLCTLARQMRAQGGTVVSVGRHTANPVRALADHSLLVASHDEDPLRAAAIYHAALHHLLDTLLLTLVKRDPAARERLTRTLERTDALYD